MAITDELFAIQCLCHTYSWSASKGDLDSLAATFTEDGRLVGFAVMLGRSEHEIVGRRAIRELFAGLLTGVDFIHQISQVGVVTVTGDTAKDEVMVSETVRWRDQDASLFLGYYADDLVRTSAGWRYAKRTLIPRAVVQAQGKVTVF